MNLQIFYFVTTTFRDGETLPTLPPPQREDQTALRDKTLLQYNSMVVTTEVSDP